MSEIPETPQEEPVLPVDEPFDRNSGTFEGDPRWARNAGVLHDLTNSVPRCGLDDGIDEFYRELEEALDAGFPLCRYCFNCEEFESIGATEIGRALGQALGLDTVNVTKFVLTVTPEAATLELKMLPPDGPATAALREVLASYRLERK